MTSGFLQKKQEYRQRGGRVAHGKNAARKGHPGREYWASRLHKGGEAPGKVTKKLTHRKERRKWNQVEWKE